jgi:hypothetical protein
LTRTNTCCGGLSVNVAMFASAMLVLSTGREVTLTATRAGSDGAGSGGQPVSDYRRPRSSTNAELSAGAETTDHSLGPRTRGSSSRQRWWPSRPSPWSTRPATPRYRTEADTCGGRPGSSAMVASDDPAGDAGITKVLRTFPDAVGPTRWLGAIRGRGSGEPRFRIRLR